MDEYLEALDGLYDTLFGDLNEIGWDTKEETKYNDKKYTRYHNNEYDIFLYVYNDYPYAYASDSDDYAEIYEWKWDAPLSKFKLEKCDGHFAKTPAGKYSRCSSDAESITQAFAALMFAAVAASLVALFMMRVCVFLLFDASSISHEESK